MAFVCSRSDLQTEKFGFPVVFTFGGGRKIAPSDTMRRVLWAVILIVGALAMPHAANAATRASAGPGPEPNSIYFVASGGLVLVRKIRELRLRRYEGVTYSAVRPSGLTRPAIRS